MVTLICIAGIAFCLIYRDRAQRPLTIAAASLAGFLLIGLGERVVEPALYGLFGSRESGGLLVSNALGLWRGFASLVQAAALAGLLWAVACDRGISFPTTRGRKK
jgi:hypothetical protein